MIRYGINRTKAFIPLKISQGTTEQRFQKARLFNLKFYDELQDCIKDKEIAPLGAIFLLKIPLKTLDISRTVLIIIIKLTASRLTHIQVESLSMSRNPLF